MWSRAGLSSASCALFGTYVVPRMHPPKLIQSTIHPVYFIGQGRVGWSTPEKINIVRGYDLGVRRKLRPRNAFEQRSYLYRSSSLSSGRSGRRGGGAGHVERRFPRRVDQDRSAPALVATGS